MGIQAPAEVKYGLIHEAVRQDGNLLNISALCRIAGVSRSGYYAWLDAAPLRQSREETDSADFALVKQAYEFRGYKKGARSIYMRLLHLDPPGHGRKFCVSDFRQTQEYHSYDVHNRAYIPCPLSSPGGGNGMRAGTA